MTKSIDKRIRAQTNAKRGNSTETLAELWIRQKGYACIERIERSWIPQWRNGKIIGAIPNKKVSGDIVAINPHNGRHVHVEVKSRDRDTLRWSDFQEHQIDAMNRKAEAGAECMILWVKGAEVRFYDWPVEGFEKGKSLAWEATE